MKNEKWEILFDKKFEGYWRGDAVPDEIKSFIKNTITAEVERGRKEVVERIINKARHTGFDRLEFINWLETLLSK